MNYKLLYLETRAELAQERASQANRSDRTYWSRSARDWRARARLELARHIRSVD